MKQVRATANLSNESEDPLDGRSFVYKYTSITSLMKLMYTVRRQSSVQNTDNLHH